MPLVGSVRLGGDAALMQSVLSTVPEATLQAQYQATADEYTFEASGCDFGALEAALRADDTVSDPRMLADFGGVRVYRVRPTMDRPLLSEAAAELDVQLLETRSVDGEWHMRMRLPDREALAALKAYCDEHGIGLQVKQLYTEAGPERVDEVLTDAQAEVLAAAYEMGYLKQPQDCSLSAVADELGISSTAASGRLRRGVAALVERHVVTG